MKVAWAVCVCAKGLGEGEWRNGVECSIDCETAPPLPSDGTPKPGDMLGAAVSAHVPRP